ncbi:type II toxin-antitoxin system Phd/YefM family antitoxin [Pleomorphomonas koreensis]|uniref:type II toxin-antitoxin system Phd/YefM family antitoxin n=1 Tax=Pleomorphomonas koreensis TaxID=257440 RepID=UPI001FDED232|nr:type II toxin-antitoxin system Phd/YefM family antitoxin [Pleomorphomonas koreensis]
MTMRDSAITEPNYKSSLDILTCEMPVMPRVDSLEFQSNFGAFLRQAQHEPVEITWHGRCEFVLMSADQYDWLKAAALRTDLTANAPDVVVDALERAEMDPEHTVLNDLLK